MREVVIRTYVTGRHLPGSSKCIVAIGLDDFPCFVSMFNLPKSNAVAYPRSSTWSPSRTQNVLANLVKMEFEHASPKSSIPHHEQAESFPP